MDYSRVSEVLNLPPVGWDGIPLHGANGIRSVKKFYLTTFQRQKVMEISSKQTLHNTEDNAISSQVDSHASHTASQESDSAKKMSDIFGQKCFALLEKYSRGGLLERMFAGYLVGMKGWYSKRCALNWKVKDTKSKRLLFQLQASALRTEEKECGLLLTPTTREEVMDLDKFKQRMEKYPNGTTMPNLATQVMALLPTPTVMDSCKTGDMTGAAKMIMGATARNSGHQIQKTLTDAVQMEILKYNPELTIELASKEFMKRTKLPTQIEFVEWIKTLGSQKDISKKTNLKLTKVEHWFRKDKVGFSYPTIEDWEKLKSHYQVPKDMDYKMTYQDSVDWTGLLPTPKTQDSRHAMRDRGKSNLGEEMSELAFQNTGKTSQLSPLFVEEMMGFPRNWTVLPFQSGEKKA